VRGTVWLEITNVPNSFYDTFLFMLVKQNGISYRFYFTLLDLWVLNL
jgi:hypothetical protein